MARRGEMTAKMLSFVEAFMGEAGFNATKAYYMSDYKCNTKSKATVDKTVSEILNHPTVDKEIKRRLKIREEKSEVKAEFLIQKLMQIIEAEQEDNPQAALRAIELAGKSIALWKERQEISGPDGEAIKHEQQIKESVTDFTNKLNSLSGRLQPQPSGTSGDDAREGTSNVVSLSDRRGEG